MLFSLGPRIFKKLMTFLAPTCRSHHLAFKNLTLSSPSQTFPSDAVVTPATSVRSGKYVSNSPNSHQDILTFLQVVFHASDHDALPCRPRMARIKLVLLTPEFCLPRTEKMWSLRCVSSTSGGGAYGCPGHVCMCSGGAPSGASGALFLTFSSTDLKGVLLGTSIGWTGATSMLAFASLCCSRSSAILVVRFPENEKFCGTLISKSEPVDDTESHTIHHVQKRNQNGDRDRNTFTPLTQTLALPLIPDTCTTTPSWKKFSPDNNGNQDRHSSNSLGPSSSSTPLLLLIISSSLNLLSPSPLPLLQYSLSQLLRKLTPTLFRALLFWSSNITRTCSAPDNSLSVRVHLFYQCAICHLHNVEFNSISIHQGPTPSWSLHIIVAPLVAAHHSLRCFFASAIVSTKTHFPFGVDLNSSQSCHSSTVQ